METKHDFTQGNILKKLVLFMVPIFGALVLQAMYGAVDLIIVGWFGTTAGISAVSTGSNLVNLVVFTVTGLSLGITVLISRYIGEKKQERSDSYNRFASGSACSCKINAGTGGGSYQLPVQLYGIFQWKRKNALCHGTGTGADVSGPNPDVIFYEYPAGCIPHEDWSGGTDSDRVWNYFVQYLFCGTREKGKNMNLTSFLNKVDQTIEKYGREELLQVIHEIARTLPESKRTDFLNQINLNAGNINRTEKTVIELKKEYEKCSHYLAEIEKGEVYLREVYNDEYDDWYNSSVEEILYEDPDGIGDMIQAVCKLIHSCVDAGEYKEAFRTGRRLFMQEILTDDEYMTGPLEVEDFICCNELDIDLKKIVLDTLYACYQVKKEAERADIMYEIWSNSGIHDLKLEDVMQHGDGGLQGFDQFLPEWIAYLGKKNSALAERLFLEAVSLTGDIAVKFENAKKYVKLHPGMYKEILNDSTISAKNAVIIGEDGMKRIARNLCVRSDVALQTAEFALVEGKDAEFMEWCYVEAFASRTNAVNYLRAFFNSTDKEKCNKKLELIVGQYNCRKNSACNNGNAGLPELAENIPEKNMLYVIQFLDGQFMEVLRKGVSEKSSLGWTGTFMKEGLALFLLYLHDGKELQQGSRSMLELTKHAFEFRLEEYKKGQNIKVEKTENEYFYELFLNWKDTTKIENSDRKKILDHIDNLMKKRVEAIMGANRRNYYGECAAYIAAIGEVKEKLGEKNAKQIYMSHYADMYTRRSAFKSELKSYGWIKR